ncbi:hypothetical protein MKW98_019428 [Papaver atlanticum]|uniref:DUF632 domain-containing protein n=1 Tax=Papaver atlanticum TaxID=357466 RepID=A0AAD4S989_9MAGN|nr:hypothetical protein MKW98_019428 [Papaver atlanticum]
MIDNNDDNVGFDSATCLGTVGGRPGRLRIEHERCNSEGIVIVESIESLSWSQFHSESKKLLLVVRHKDLAEITACIKEYFEKAIVAGEPVSDLLEISRAQFDRSFRQLKSKNCVSFEFSFDKFEFKMDIKPSFGD